jgi:multiple sugar transport system permease protein
MNHSREYSVAYLFIIPSLLGFFVFYAVPAVRGLIISLTDWDLLGKPVFIGIGNYLALMRDEAFWNSLWVTVLYVLWNIPVQTALALLIAVVMTKKGKSMAFRGAMLVPWLLPNVVVALLWLWLMDPALGIINVLAKSIGGRSVGFLTTTELALPSIALINIWRHMGYTALIVFAGLQGIPKEIDEAALIDGASGWRLFSRITLPLLRPVLAFVVMTSVIGSFQIYDTVAITTRGGPVAATWVLNFFIYKNAFENYQMGYSTAASMVLFLILVGVAVVQMRLMRAGEAD